LVIDLAEDLRRASEPILLNNEPLWSEAPYSVQWSPCINFTLDGLINPENVYWQAGISHEFIGNIWQDNPLSCLAAGWLVVPTVGVHPYYGTQGYNMLSFAPNGEPVRSLGPDPKQSPRWKTIHCLRRIENGDIAVCGEVETIDEYLELTTGTALALYNRLGEVSTTLVTSAEPSTMFKNVFGRVP
jgi:hypothetical protein